MTPLLLGLAFALLAMTGPSSGIARSLPMIEPGAERIAGPSLRGDCFEIRLRPQAAARARTVPRQRTTGTAVTPAWPARSLGVAELDAAAASVGAWFEPEFPGEAAPAAGAAAADFTAFYLVYLPAGLDLASALASFRALGAVQSADAIAVLPVSRVPNDSLWAFSPWYFDPTGRHDIHAPEAWEVTTGDSAVVVAVLDTGVLPYHPDLGGVMAGLSGQLWTNAAEAAGLTGVDDDGNGYVDDVHGWDFVELPSGSGVPAREDWRDADPDPNDYAGHGTAVAGLIGALTDNGRGVAGTAWSVRLMPLRIGWSEIGAPLGVVDMAFVARAIRYATRMGAHVLNCSFSTLNTSGLYEAAAAAAQAGVLIVAAAGNGDPYHDLADREDVLAVAATDAGDAIASFSNLGTFVDVAAPGVGMRSTFLSHAALDDSLRARQPAYAAGLNGTSFSAPLAAGTAALVLARQRATGGPALRPMELLFRLRETADDIAAQNPGVGGYGGGRLNALRALSETEVSFAARVAGGGVGAPVVVATTGAERRVVCALDSGQLLVLDGAGATVRVVPLPAAPQSGLASADLGGGLGVGMFVALRNGALAGFDGLGAPLAGWPVSVAGAGLTLATTPVLGDLDGDGVLEVVCGASDGSVHAWRADGTVLAPFPLPTDGWGLSADLAVSDLDGVAGAEVIAATFAGGVYAYRCDLASPSVPGWPKVVSGVPLAPLVMRLGARSAPCVVVAFGSTLRAYQAPYAVRFSRALGGTAVANPAAADLDDDGYDEIVVPLGAPDAIAVFDSSGAPWLSHGWPRAVSGALSGEAVVRTLAGDPAHGQMFVPVGGRLRAFGPEADSLREFPKPGRAIAAATASAVDTAGPVRLLAGSGTDSLVYFYALPQPSAPGAERGWYTARGNFARTASRLYAPPPGLIEDVPARVTDLAAVAVTESSVTLHWTATGEYGTRGRPADYDVRAGFAPLASDAAFDSAPLAHTVPATVDAGGMETFVFAGLERARTYWFALRARGTQGQRSRVSNSVSARTPVGGPIAGRAGVSVAVRSQPSRLPVVFFWQGAGVAREQFLRIYDLGGRQLRRLPLGADLSGVTEWNGRDERGGLVPAGVYFARLTSGSFHAQTRVVLLP